MKTTIFCLSLLLFSIDLLSTTYFVSNAGNNANSGLNLSNALLTIQEAVDRMSPGDSVYVSNGIYAGFDLRGSDASLIKPTVFKALGYDCTITTKGPFRDDGINIENSDYVILDGFRIVGMLNDGNGIRVVRSNHCTVRNCFSQANGRGIFTGFTDDIIIEHNICVDAYDEHGIYVSNSSDRPIIRYNTCARNRFIGIHINADATIIDQPGDDGIISDAMVYGNIIYDNNLAAGINMDGCENPVVFNNLIYNNHSAQGIALFQIDGAIPTRGAKIFNNTIWVPTDGRWGILVRPGSNVGTEIYNNIIANEHSFRGSIVVWDTTDFTSDYNIVYNKMSNIGDGDRITFSEWQDLGLDQNSILVNNLNTVVKDVAGRNFLPQNNSVANNAGTNSVLPVVSKDLINTNRPQQITIDIGAFEFPKITNCSETLELMNINIIGNYFSSNLMRLKSGLNFGQENLRFFSPMHEWFPDIEIPQNTQVDVFTFGCIP